jgi:carbonic anhydrase/acetyltransferase-like protein (isoleucine patch superfamily)
MKNLGSEARPVTMEKSQPGPSAEDALYGGPAEGERDSAGHWGADSMISAPQVHESVFIAPGAMVVGDVTIGAGSSVWYSAVLRGDMAAILIGEESNIQDGCIIHVNRNQPCWVGDRVTLGHGAVVHGCVIESDVLIGIRAIVLDGAVIGSGSIVGAGAVVTEGTVIPPDSLVMGVPGRVVGVPTDQQRLRVQRAAAHYVRAAQVYRTALLDDLMDER